jgi:hypothetical protein
LPHYSVVIGFLNTAEYLINEYNNNNNNNNNNKIRKAKEIDNENLENKFKKATLVQALEFPEG